MAFDTLLAQRVKALMLDLDGLTEKKMFGGVGFMLHGNMACGVNKDDLIVRVGPEAYDEALEQPNTRIFDFTGREMKGWIMVSPEGTILEADLERLVKMGTDFALTLPPK